MSGNHPKTEAWDMALHQAIVRTDAEMERRFGAGIRLRHNRPPTGSTANPQMDSLFNIGLVFMPGYNSELGRGYWLDLEIASRDSPSPEQQRLWTDTCKDILESELRLAFPDRNLRFKADSGRWKLQGDFTLGQV